MIAEAAVLTVVLPLLFVVIVRKRHVSVINDYSQKDQLGERKTIIYENLRDLQFEFRMGKLSQADYQASKSSLQNELAQLLTITICSACGSSSPQDMKFCGNCGKQLGGTDAHVA